MAKKPPIPTSLAKTTIAGARPMVTHLPEGTRLLVGGLAGLPIGRPSPTSLKRRDSRTQKEGKNGEEHRRETTECRRKGEGSELGFPPPDFSALNRPHYSTQ